MGHTWGEMAQVGTKGTACRPWAPCVQPVKDRVGTMDVRWNFQECPLTLMLILTRTFHQLMLRLTDTYTVMLKLTATHTLTSILTLIYFYLCHNATTACALGETP